MGELQSNRRCRQTCSTVAENELVLLLRGVLCLSDGLSKAGNVQNAGSRKQRHTIAQLL